MAEPDVRRLRSGVRTGSTCEANKGIGLESRPSDQLSSNRLRVTRQVLTDPKVFKNQTVVVKRLSPNVIKRHDKKFFQKYAKRLKEEQNLQKYSKIAQILTKSQMKTSKRVATGESPKRMVLWTNPCPQSTSALVNSTHPVLRSHPNYLKHWAKCDERENSLMSQSEYCRNLNLISRKDLSRMNDRQLKTTFCLRNVAKSDYTVNDNNQVEIDPKFVLQCLNTAKVSFSYPKVSKTQLIESNNEKPKRKKSKKNMLTANKIKEKYKKLDKQKKKLILRFKEQYLNCLSLFDMSSPMGRRIFVSLKTSTLESSKVQTLVKRYDESSPTKIRFKARPPNEFNKWKARNIEKLCTGQELSQRQRDMNCFQYSFTRRQRLDRWQRLITGLEWRSRLLALQCNENKVLVTREDECPLCGDSLEVDHSCDMNASKRKPHRNSPPVHKTNVKAKHNPNKSLQRSTTGTDSTASLDKWRSPKRTERRTVAAEAEQKARANEARRRVCAERVCTIDLDLHDSREIFIDLSDDD